MQPKRPSLPPLDAASLDRLALRYVERFATTRGRLADYLDRKIRVRGWQSEAVDTADGSAPLPDTRAIADRLAGLGYIDDLAFGEARSRSMARRGLGARRVASALRAAGVDAADSAALQPAIAERTLDSALAYARRRRIGPFANDAAPPEQRRKQLAAMLRAGHDFGLARRIVAMAPGEDIDPLQAQFEGG